MGNTASVVEQAGRKATRVKERSPSLVSLLLLHSARLKQSGSKEKKKKEKKKKHTTTKMISSTKLAGGRKGLHLRVASRRPKGLVRADRSALRQRDARRNAPTWIAKAQNEEEFDLIDKLQKPLEKFPSSSLKTADLRKGTPQAQQRFSKK